MTLKEFVNSPESALGSEILEMTKDGTDPETARRLVERYMQNKDVIRLKTDVYYRVRSVTLKRNADGEPEVYLERDCLKSPRDVPEWQKTFDLIAESGDTPKGEPQDKPPVSFDGGFILRWAYFQNKTPLNPYFVDGCDIVSRYGKGDNAIRKNHYYFLSRNEHGVSIRRDLSRSPRKEKGKESDSDGRESEAVASVAGK